MKKRSRLRQKNSDLYIALLSMPWDPKAYLKSCKKLGWMYANGTKGLSNWQITYAQWHSMMKD